METSGQLTRRLGRSHVLLVWLDRGRQIFNRQATPPICGTPDVLALRLPCWRRDPTPERPPASRAGRRGCRALTLSFCFLHASRPVGTRRTRPIDESALQLRPFV